MNEVPAPQQRRSVSCCLSQGGFGWRMDQVTKFNSDME